MDVDDRLIHAWPPSTTSLRSFASAGDSTGITSMHAASARRRAKVDCPTRTTSGSPPGMARPSAAPALRPESRSLPASASIRSAVGVSTLSTGQRFANLCSIQAWHGRHIVRSSLHQSPGGKSEAPGHAGCEAVRGGFRLGIVGRPNGTDGKVKILVWRIDRADFNEARAGRLAVGARRFNAEIKCQFPLAL